MQAWLLSLIIVFVILQIFMIMFLFSYSVSIERYTDNTIRVYRLNTALSTQKVKVSMKLPVNFLDAINSSNIFTITETYNDANMIIFDSLNNIENILAKFVYPPSVNYIFAIKGTDNLASKVAFTNMLRGTAIIPKSYDVTNKESVHRLFQDFHTTYIIKKNIQQQQGLRIIENTSDLKSALSDKGYVVCQELLKDPMIVARRKINIRIYLLVVMRNGGDPEFYMYDDGFMYYALREWDITSIDSDVHITTGLQKDRSIYNYGPLTYQDLLKEDDKRGALLDTNIKSALSIVKSKYATYLKDMNTNIPITSFSLFGCDIAPSNSGSITIMEVNKGPDLSYKDNRDGQIKKDMTMEMLKVVCRGHDEQNSRFKIIL